MRNPLEDFYYSSITSSEQQMKPNSDPQRAVERSARCETQLIEPIEEAEQETLTKLIRSQHEIHGITALENFILNFRLSVRLMVEYIDEDDAEVGVASHLHLETTLDGRPVDPRDYLK